jgi:hypothetical protein
VTRLPLDPQVAPAPASIGDWEELLIRFELGPRAVRLATADAGDAGHAAARDVYADLLQVESEAAGWLGVPIPPEGDDGSADRARERFERLRGTSFARIQRRGPDEAERVVQAGDAEATVHQVLVALVRHDGAKVARLRGGEVAR